MKCELFWMREAGYVQQLNSQRASTLQLFDGGHNASDLNLSSLYLDGSREMTIL